MPKVEKKMYHKTENRDWGLKSARRSRAYSMRNHMKIYRGINRKKADNYALYFEQQENSEIEKAIMTLKSLSKPLTDIQTISSGIIVHRK